jgi:hypothetical protein
MALDFPNNPVDGDTWTDGNGVEWEFKGYGWKEIKVPTLLSMSDVSPATPTLGDRLQWDGSKWSSAAGTSQLALTDLADITGTPVKDDYLVHDGTNFVMASSNSDPQLFAKSETRDGRSISGYETLGNNVWFNLEYARIVVDNDNMFDLVTSPERLTIQTAGIYRINFMYVFSYPGTSTADEIMSRCQVYNSSDALQGQYYDWAELRTSYISTDAYFCRSNFVRSFAVGDYIKVQTRRDGSTFDYVGCTNLSLSALKIGDNA